MKSLGKLGVYMYSKLKCNAFVTFRIFRIIRIFCLFAGKPIMTTIEQRRKPSKSEQKVARDSYPAVLSVLSHINGEETEIEIEESKERIKIPSRALELLSDILKAMSEGVPISIVPIATEVTTQKAAEILGCSRPYLIKLLEEGQIPFVKVGKHRRIKFEDVVSYKQKMKKEQKQSLIDIMTFDEENGLYDS
jgi:excisionase family DNA binding protein